MFEKNFNLTTLNGLNGFAIDGLAVSDRLGWSVSIVGDINGDGEADIVLGAPYADPDGLIDAGSVYVIFGQGNAFPPRFNLTILNGNNGFAIDGLAVTDQLGYSVNTAGDINGDGKADMVLGAPNADPGGRNNAGTAYVIFGQGSGFPSQFDLTVLNGLNGFAIDGVTDNDQLGYSATAAKDLNGDGRTDLVVGANNASPSGRSGAGTVYVIFGQSSGWPARFDLTTLTGSNGFAIDGVNAGDYLGYYARNVMGDINGDGKAELTLAAHGADPGGRNYAGTVYVIFGQTSNWPGRFDLTTLNGSNGFAIDGLSAGDGLGWSVSTAGDVDGDNKSDLVLGAFQASPGGRSTAGTVYVIFGKVGGWSPNFDLTTLNGINGFAIDGLVAQDYLGDAISTAGDINGDGRADLVLGASGADPGGRSSAGTVYVVFGQASGFPSRFDLTTLNGTNGFTIDGLGSGDQLGYRQSVSTGGDVGGDGQADLVMGAPYAGTAYVIFSSNVLPTPTPTPTPTLTPTTPTPTFIPTPTPTPTPVLTPTVPIPTQYAPSFDLTTLNGANGFVVPGISSGDYLGHSVNTAGDINGDGKTDLVLGAFGVSNDTGAAYVIFGWNSFTSPFDLTTLNGTNGFVVPGISSGDYLGYSVSEAGDINGDGKGDLVLGANWVADTGAAYVIFGQNRFTSPFNLTTLNGTNGFMVPGIASSGTLGRRVNTAGDINGDGKDDLVLGARGVSGETGAAYIIFGQNSFTSPFDLTTLNGTNGFVIPGLSSGDYLGTSAGLAGDINGDGKTDLVLGAQGVSGDTGAAYIIFGQNSFTSPFNLTTLNGINGFVVPGILSGDYLGASVSTAGDINQDGKGDLVLGAPGSTMGSPGAVYVIFGQSNFTSPFDLMTLNGTNGFVVPGISGGDNLGISVNTALDLNRDGKTDLVLGAQGVSSHVGAAYVIFGQNSFTSPFNLTTLNSANGFVVPGTSSDGYLGISVGAALDMNEDGKTDLVLGAHGVSNTEGAAYVIFGQNTTAIPVNRPPMVTHAIPNQLIEVGTPFNFTIASDTFTDPDGDSLTYSAQQTDGNPLPSWLSFEAKGRFFSGIASLAGTTPLRVAATDTGNLSTYANFTLAATEPTATNALTSTPSNSLGALVGGIVGGVVGFCGLLGLGGYGLYRRWSSKLKPGNDFQPTELMPVETGNEYSKVAHTHTPAITSTMLAAPNPARKQPPKTNIEVIPITTESSSSSDNDTKPTMDINSVPLVVDSSQKRLPRKSWYFDPQTKAKRIAANKVYELIEATDVDRDKVIEFYQHHPVSGYDIASIQVIHNPDMNHEFALHMKKLQQRDNNPAFKAKWPTGRENQYDPIEPAENTAWRQVIHDQFKAMAKPYQDNDYPAVNLLPMWHGTKAEIVDSIFRTGYAALSTTDAGFFGRGIYSAHEAEYSYRVYAKEGGALILNWTACFSAYPVINYETKIQQPYPGDMNKFVMKNEKKQDISISAAYSNYDAHFVPVVPRNPDNPDEIVYYPTKPKEPHQYTELVVFESAACLPRYLVQLQRTLEPPLPLNRNQYHGMFFPSVQEAKKDSQQEKTIANSSSNLTKLL